jgi:hypothetical protein
MMNYPSPRFDRSQYLSGIRDSDETIEELLSGGADIDDLIEVDVFENEPEEPTEAEPETNPLPRSKISPPDVDTDVF